jgi:hypothetical protein
MKPEDLERILFTEKQIEPSPTFCGDVMVHVQAEASYKPIPFPWIPFAAIILVLAILVLWLYPADSVLRAANVLVYTTVNWFIAPSDIALRNVLLAAFESLALTLLLVWFSLRLAGANR